MTRLRTAGLHFGLAILALAPGARGDRLGGAFRGYFGDLSLGLGGGPHRIEEVLAYWPYYFEHNREVLLADRLRHLRAMARHPAQSSVTWFRAGGGMPASPVTEEQKREVVLPLLVEAVVHEHPWVRDAAILALGKLGGEEVVPHLALRLEDPDADLREDALLALGLTREPSALTPLLAALSGEDADRSAFAALGLALLGDAAATEPLLRASEAHAEAGRQTAAGCAALALATAAEPDRRIVKALVSHLPRENGVTQRIFVHHALGLLGGGRAMDHLIRALEDRGDASRSAALALGGFDDEKVVRQLLGSDGLKSGLRMKQLFSLASLCRIAARGGPVEKGPASLTDLLTEWATELARDKYKAQHASLHLGLLGDRSANANFAKYLDPARRLKWSDENHSAMAMALGLSGDRRAVEDLRDIISRRAIAPDYRGYAAFALGLMGDRESLPPLRAILDEPRQRHEVLRSGCLALALMGDRSDIDRLVGVLSRKEPEFHHARGAAATAIGLLGDGTTVAPLVDLASTAEDPTTRAFAIAALGWLIDQDDVPRLPLLFANFDYRIRGAGESLLRRVMSTL